MPGGRDGELVFTREFVLHGLAGAHHREGDEVFGKEFLLAAEAATHTSGEHPHTLAGQVEDVADLVADEVGNLAGGAQHQPPILVEPAAGGMGLEGGVADALGVPGARDNGRG